LPFLVAISNTTSKGLCPGKESHSVQRYDQCEPGNAVCSNKKEDPRPSKRFTSSARGIATGWVRNSHQFTSCMGRAITPLEGPAAKPHGAMKPGARRVAQEPTIGFKASAEVNSIPRPAPLEALDPPG